ncbi:MAG: hypothetical protein RMK29_12640 [Myxococcales bacterium]|nr:hypothetical protein [Myxococcota bacterium]MDW8282552.1 hypothetical protein [Myxococcales bacterium]
MPGDVAILRDILQRELETINVYEALMERLADPRLRQIVAHITNEEREHVAEIYELILEQDAIQRATSQRGRQYLEDALAASPTPAAGATPTAKQDQPAMSPGRALDLTPPPPPVFPQSGWSVGPLRQRS